VTGVGSAEIEISGEDATRQGVLVLTLLPGSAVGEAVPSLLNLREDSDRDKSLEAIQLLEGSEYRYEFRFSPEHSVISTDRPEIFAPDDHTGLTGRLRPGLRVGGVPVTVGADGRTLGIVRFEVRAKKLDYVSQYRWMLRGIAEVATSHVALDITLLSQRQKNNVEPVMAAMLGQRGATKSQVLLVELRTIARLREPTGDPPGRGIRRNATGISASKQHGVQKCVSTQPRTIE